MTIKFNPRISTKFTKFVLANKIVKDLSDELSLEEEKLVELAKAILITGFTRFDVDINNIINMTKEHNSKEQA